VTTAGRGIRNAFRNATRTISIILILGLAIGLAVVMLTAHRSVSDKIAATLGSVGNNVTIGPSGYSTGELLGKNLTAAELAPIARIHGVTGIDESLNGAANTIGAPQNPCPKGATCHPAGGRHAIKLGSTNLKSPMSVSAEVGWGVILEALTAAVVVALLASAATTWMVGRIQPAEAVRSE
jgi:putative ABC transport system permease protein